ncbi:MAG: hypothetical protein V7K77_34755 [Nostoc sp.]
MPNFSAIAGSTNPTLGRNKLATVPILGTVAIAEFLLRSNLNS